MLLPFLIKQFFAEGPIVPYNLYVIYRDTQYFMIKIFLVKIGDKIIIIIFSYD